MSITTIEVIMGKREFYYPIVNVKPDPWLSQGEDLSRDTAKAEICEWKLGMLVPVSLYKVSGVM